MDTSYQSIRSRPVIVLLAVGLALILAGCPGPDGVNLCDCPNLEATVGSIDWVGDGSTHVAVETGIDVSPFQLRATVSFETSNQVVEQERLAARIADAGLIAVADQQYSDTFQGDDWRVHIQTGGTEDNQEVTVFVWIVEDDERAARILAPLVDALGTLP